jgi:hypothetical protein
MCVCGKAKLTAWCLAIADDENTNHSIGHIIVWHYGHPTAHRIGRASAKHRVMKKHAIRRNA